MNTPIEECGAQSEEHAKGGIALLTADVHGDDPEGVAVFCPDCARVEFGFRSEHDETA